MVFFHFDFKRTLANSGDPDQGLGLHCLPMSYKKNAIGLYGLNSIGAMLLVSYSPLHVRSSLVRPI